MAVKFEPTATIVTALGVQKNGPVMKKLINSAYRRMGKYVPAGAESKLNKLVKFTDHSIIYDSLYAHYQYIGKLYVMENGKGAYYNPNYGFWSKPRGTKTATDRDLQHPYGGGPYWAEEMMTAEGESLRAEIERYVREKL